MSRSTVEACKATRDGRHRWRDVTTKDDDGRTRYMCMACGKETVE